MEEKPTILGLRVALAVLILVAGWAWQGPFGVVFFSPLAGVALAKPLLEAIAGRYRDIRGKALEEYSGRHFAYKSTRLAIEEDDACYRWLRTSDVRLILPAFPRDGVLQKLCAEGLTPILSGGKPDLLIKAETLEAFLASSQTLATIKFRNWLRKEIIFPAQQMRGRRS